MDQTNRNAKKNLYMALVIATVGIIAWFLMNPPQAKLIAGLSHQLPGSFSNPDTNRNIHEIIESRGFQSESHFVTTRDGYILQLVRIVNPILAQSERSQLKPVLLFHGFQCSGSLWIVATNGTLDQDGHYYEVDENEQIVNGSSTVGNTLGFVLATRGYDVWLASYRGSIYSTNHTRLSTDSTEFWSFSIDDMINTDLPTLIKHIQKETNHKQIGYIGHSQGNLMMFSLLSTQPEYSQVIKPFIALSPVFYIDKVLTPLRHFAPLKNFLLSYPSFVPFSSQVRYLYTNLCENQVSLQVCYTIYYYFLGSFRQNIDMNRLPVYMANVPMGSSSWNAAHIFQMMSLGKPQCFDYGNADKNRAVYGSDEPPFYNASNINSKHIALIYTKNDWFNHLDNIESLKNDLTVNLLDDYAVPDETWNHMDLVWAKQVGQYVNTRILDLLSKY